MSEEGISDTTLSCATTALANRNRVEPTVVVNMVKFGTEVWMINLKKRVQVLCLSVFLEQSFQLSGHESVVG
jgi:hypothetical protein